MVQVARRVRDAGAEVNSVHIPPETETLLSTPGHGRDAVDLMDKCLSAALAAGARVAVVHAWDLRCPEFSQSCLIEGLNRFGRSFGDRGVSLSVENIPGQLRMLGIIADSCAQVSFTADTRWAAMEDSWGLLSDLIPRLTNVHVQTYVDPLEAGGVTLGRTGTGLGAKSFHAERVMRSFAEGGYSGLVTLEPNNVQNIDETHLRQALEMLSRWCGRVLKPD
jgi:sugar phosphate isomerase/epimerase